MNRHDWVDLAALALFTGALWIACILTLGA